jgi:signal transduction histidine kinase/ActR/RegA family two-component response regulator
MLKFSYIDKKLNKVFAKNTDSLNKVRVQFLINALIASILIIAITLPGFYLNSFYFLLFRSILIIVVQLALIWILLNTTKWKLVAHGACIIVATLIFSNIFVNVQGVKIISLQFMLILIVMSYYLLGNKWGIFYSAVSGVFMLIYFMLFGRNAMAIIEKENTDNFTFITVFVFNFLLIIYLQYHFFNAFNRTIRQLKVKQEKEKLLNLKLQEAIKASDESSKAKSNFLSTISHELRTPLNGVIGMSNVLLLDNPRTEQQENLNILKFSANNLLNLINDVLDINKIESGKIEIEKIPFKIFDLIKYIYKAFENRAKEKKLAFNLDLNTDLNDVVLVGDPTRLTQILNNLIENALKFTETGEVKLSINIKEKKDNTIKLYFCVSDSGIGIPLEKQKLIFDSFSQASTSTTRTYGGTGLGLAIVKNLLELHHSEIKTKSEVNVGTSFEFEIVYNFFESSHNLSSQTNLQSVENMDISNLKILIAEDNQMNILLMRKLLAKWNIKPDFAANGSEAVAAFKINNYDLILMDIHMPIMDGYEASKMIRSETDDVKAKIPIIALTASVALDVRNKINQAGINDFVSKPFNPDELRGKLEAIASEKIA